MAASPGCCVRVRRLAFQIRPGQRQTLRCPAGDGSAVGLAALLHWLLAKGTDNCLWLWRELVGWCAWVLETGPLWADASPDPLDIPAPFGVQRVQRLHPELINAAGQAAGQGTLGRTGRRLARVLKFAARRRFGGTGLTEVQANTAQATRGKRYRQCARNSFGVDKVRVVSVSMDATRLGQKDTLMAALYDPQQNLACWADPMAAPKNHNGQKLTQQFWHC